MSGAFTTSKSAGYKANFRARGAIAVGWIGVLILLSMIACGGGVGDSSVTHSPVPVVSAVEGETRYANKYPSIQMAFDDLPASGGTLRVPAGDYGQLFVSKSNVAIIGDGPTSVLTATAKTNNTIVIAPGVSNVTIQKLSIRGAWTGVGETWDEENYWKGNAVFSAGTLALPNSKIVISDNYIANGNNGVLLRVTNDSRVERNQFYQSVSALAQVLLTSSERNTISDNSFEDVAGSANAIYLRQVCKDDEAGIDDYEHMSNHNSITGNTMDAQYRYEAINVAGSYNTIEHNTIRINNVFKSVDSTGIALFATWAARSDAGGANHNSVTGNTIEIVSPIESTGGILLVDNDSIGRIGASDNTISDNSITVMGSGITVVRSKRNTLTGNHVVITGGTGSDGILLAGVASTDIVVSNNNVSGYSGHGIEVQAIRSKVSDNVFSAGTNVNGAGIFVPNYDSEDGNESLIEHNTVLDSAGRGISIAGTHSGLVLNGNTSLNNRLPDSYGSTPHH